MTTVLPGYTWINNPRGGGGSYATDGPSSILLHMTVSTALSASYVGRHPYPPHFWANPYTGDKWQTVSPDRSAFALYQPPYGPWINKKGYTLQTELVGYPVVNVATYTDAHLRWIAEHVVVPQAVWLNSVGRPVNLHQVRYHSDSSGSASVDWHGRLTEAEWDAYSGILAHIDATGNDHWDCSVERLDLIAKYAREKLGDGPPEPLPFPGDDVVQAYLDSNRTIWYHSGLFAMPVTNFDMDQQHVQWGIVKAYDPNRPIHPWTLDMFARADALPRP